MTFHSLLRLLSRPEPSPTLHWGEPTHFSIEPTGAGYWGVWTSARGRVVRMLPGNPYPTPDACTTAARKWTEEHKR